MMGFVVLEQRSSFDQVLLLNATGLNGSKTHVTWLTAVIFYWARTTTRTKIIGIS